MSLPHWEVIVVGAGPCGSTAAQQIAAAGRRVLLLERDSYPGENNSCGGGLGAFLQRRFQLPDSLIHKKVNVVRLDLGFVRKTYRADRPIYLSIKRTEFDKYLAERAVAAGAELRVRQTALGYDPYHKLLRVLDRASGAAWAATAEIVIFADGARTLAWRECGLGVDPDRDPIIGLAWELDWPNNPCDAFEFLFDEARLPYGYFWIFPTTDTVNVGVGGPARDIAKRAKALLAEFIEQRPELRGRRAVRKTAGFIPGHLAARLHGDGVMVVGDAAGFVNPLTGGGIYLGMRSAETAARVAVEALRAGRADHPALAAYSRRIKFSPYWAGLQVFHGLVRWSQARRLRTGRPVLGKVFKLYSDIGDFALRRL